MRQLILEEWVSLDGFAVDGEGTLNFFPPKENDRFSDLDQLKFLDTVDTVLLGRKTYELFVEFWPTATTEQEVIADRLNGLSKVVFSKTLKGAPWGNWSPACVVAGDAVAVIKQMKAAQGKDIVLWGSLSLAEQLMHADLIDEYHLQICPTIVGGGRRLFPTLPEYARLNRVALRTYDSGVVFVSYRRAPA